MVYRSFFFTKSLNSLHRSFKQVCYTAVRNSKLEVQPTHCTKTQLTKENRMMGGGMMGSFSGFGGGLGGLGLFGSMLSLVFSLGLLVALAWLGVWLWRKLSAPTGTGLTVQPQEVQPSSAREILKARYARGELTREEFQTMLQDLA
jgi:putative membrane protein